MDVVSAEPAAPRSAADAFLAEHLNPAQREAVTAPDGPLLILAGAGSGKTRVIAYRIAYFIKERGIHPGEILAVTFTNKAAAEMKQRVEQLVGPPARSVVLGTFHSICARFLRRDIRHIGYEPSFSIYDEDDQLALLKRLYAEAGINPKQYAPQAVRAAISRAKDNLLTPQQFAQQADSPFALAASTLYRRYQEALHESNALDFDDLLGLMLRVFDESPDALAAYQRRFRHVLVDEYQDVNKAQYLLVRRLAHEHRNLTIVGDDSQAIYGWRGADVRYMLQFEEDFPECRVVRLEQNYRSTKTILEAARAVEESLEARHLKELWTDNPQGVPITLCHAIDEVDEAAFVAREIERLVSNGECHYRDVAVMYRMNAQSRALEEMLVKRRLPYQLVGGTRFYERREIKDLLAYLRLIHNPADTVSLERIINVPNRGIGDKTLDELRNWASELGVPLAHALYLLRQAEDTPGAREHLTSLVPPFSGRAKGQLLAFVRLLADLGEAARQVRLEDLFDSLVQRTGYREYLEADKAGEERWENVKELRSVISQYAGLAPATGLRAFLEDVSLITDVDTMKDENDTVTLMTLHASKGLEFPVVFLVGLEEGIFPHSRAVDEGSLDEERRLCYVGITRAMRRLYLVHCERRTVYGLPRPGEPSQFLAALPAARTQYVNSHGVAIATDFSGGLGGLGGLRGAGGVGRWGTVAGSAGSPSTSALPGARPWSGTGSAVGGVLGNVPGLRTADQLSRPRKHFGPSAPTTPATPGTRSTPPGAQPAQPTPPVQRFNPGDRVRHQTFGDGVVVESTITRRGEEEVRVRFETAGIRILLGAMAPMEVLQ